MFKDYIFLPLRNQIRSAGQQFILKDDKMLATISCNLIHNPRKLIFATDLIVIAAPSLEPSLFSQQALVRGQKVNANHYNSLFLPINSRHVRNPSKRLYIADQNINKHEWVINHWMGGAYSKQAAHSLLQTLHPGPQRDPLACFQDQLHTYSITNKVVKLQVINSL